MAQPASNPKIEELRFRVKTDPKSRLFFPLAEELRKIDQLGEAEQVLRTGLTQHPTYLSAWVSLGRVLREEDKYAEAVDALTKALQLDPGNVVAARLLADAYLDLGDKLEAIKKYKLVRALLPANEELDGIIERLEDELNPVTVFKADDTLAAAPTVAAQVMGDEEPMRAAHAESPFEEPVTDYSAAAVSVERPEGVHVEPAPLAAEVPAPWPDEEAASEVFAPAEAPPAPQVEDVANTMTMADLYVRQGFLDKARQIYQNILQRDPDNSEVRHKLDALVPAARNPKVDKLERWLAKMTRREEGSAV
jgi:tetratricopeptide (TPR) repeat protein